ncbi:MAG: hypothetical protein WD768_10820 [Phycisphaeraceae bacterium]
MPKYTTQLTWLCLALTWGVVGCATKDPPPQRIIIEPIEIKPIHIDIDVTVHGEKPAPQPPKAAP